MKRIANALVVVALICVSLLAVHGVFLIRADLKSQQAPVVTPKTTPQQLPSEIPTKPSSADYPVVSNSSRPATPETHLKTVAMLPEQAVNFRNQKFRKVRVRSEYPVRVLTGKCHSDYTVDLACDGDPADIFITDARRVPIFTTPRSNTVDVTVTEF